MIRRLAPLSALLLASACTIRPWTPSVSVAFWAEDVPEGRLVNLPTAADALRKWQLPPGDPYRAYVKPTLFASLDALDRKTTVLPDVEALEIVHRARRAARAIAAAGLPPDVGLVVDLRGAASVAFGAELSRYSKHPVSLVPTFHNWPNEDELIPAEETLAALVAEDPRPAILHTHTVPVFLLDAWRLAYRFDEPEPGVFDNRYMLGPADLPDAAALRAQGIHRLLYVIDDFDDTEVEEDDLHHTFRALLGEGIALSMTDLAWLEAHGAAPGVALAFDEHPLRVEPRLTLVDDPLFYRRAVGGFGGLHGIHFGGGLGHIGPAAG